MPLTFSSLSHGTVAFGFYNIETDGLLLERHFFFATDFCRAVETLAGPACHAPLSAHRFDDPREIGDLMGAIHGVRFEGFLGELYQQWPFPLEPEGFRQKLEGGRNRARVEAILDRRASRERLDLTREPRWEEVRLGPYRFDRPGFIALLGYVWRGGHPTWEGFETGRNPPWVEPLGSVMKTLTCTDLDETPPRT